MPKGEGLDSQFDRAFACGLGHPDYDLKIMGTNCAPLVADLFLFCYERDFMMSLSDDKQANVIDAFNTTSR